MTAEEWRPIPGYEGAYEVSDRGQVRSSLRIPRTGGGPRVLSPAPFQSGHLHVELRGPEGPRTVRVHHAVLAAFVGPMPEGLEVRHLDGDPANNRLDNLRYGTRSENMFDQVRHGVHPSASKTHCKHGHPLSGQNVILYQGGRWRRCRTCKATYSRQYRARQADRIETRRAVADREVA